jgi:hypothetical protein
VLTTASALYLAVLVLDYLVRGPKLASGLMLVAGMIVLFMGAVLLSIGIVGSYVFPVFEEVLGRPRYLLSDSTTSRWAIPSQSRRGVRLANRSRP